MKEAPNDLENGLFRRMVTEDGKYELAIHPVMFGFRIRAGEVGSGFCAIDYCCERDILLLFLAYTGILAIMTHRSENKEPLFAGLPVPQDKFFKEPECLIKLMELAPADSLRMASNIKAFTPAELNSYRSEFMAHYGFGSSFSR